MLEEIIRILEEEDGWDWQWVTSPEGPRADYINTQATIESIVAAIRAKFNDA